MYVLCRTWWLARAWAHPQQQPASVHRPSAWSDPLPHAVANSGRVLCRHTAKLAAINLFDPTGPAQWKEVPAPAEQIHGPRPLPILHQAPVPTLQRRGLYHALADPAAGPRDDIRAPIAMICSMLKACSCMLQVIYGCGWVVIMRAIERQTAHGTPVGVAASLHDALVFSLLTYLRRDSFVCIVQYCTFRSDHDFHIVTLALCLCRGVLLHILPSLGVCNKTLWGSALPG